MDNTVMKGAYTSFGGADISAVIGNNVVGTLQAISYSVQREKGPVYTMRGSADPLAFARGKRAIAGTLVFLTIDQQAFLSHMEQYADTKFYGQKKDIRFSTHETSIDSIFKADALASLFDDANPTSTNSNTPSTPGDDRILTNAWYADQVRPFDVNVGATSEFGQAMKKSFYGVEILNEAGGVSIDDLVIEESFTYICRGMTKWTKLNPRAAM